ncbi:MAG: hypothetical protein M1812_002752 [Candelaria pacifica]|nr:MAG: hypothetical protein M1812_002752 [Candelaria pacifica]
MPARTTGKAPPPALSSNSSSLSSAPDIAEIEAEVPVIAGIADKDPEQSSRESIDGNNSRASKRRRTRPTAEVTTPTKRAKRSVKAVQLVVKQEATPIDSARKITKSQASKSNGVKAEQVEAVAGAIGDTTRAATNRISRRPKAAAKIVKVEETEEEEEATSKEPNKVKRRRKAKEKESTKSEEVVPEEPKKVNKNKKTNQQEVTIEEGVDSEEPKKVKKKRKTKEEKELEAMPIAARTKGLKMFIGAHVSAAKGVQNAVTNCVHIGGNAFALFLKSQRKWENPPLVDEHTTQFLSHCNEHKFDAASHVLPHGSYLVNLAQKDADKAKQAYDAFLDDLHRCERLGIKLYNFHPGNTGPSPRPEAIARIADRLNAAHRSTSTVKTVLENMAGTGNVIGSTFEDLRDIIALVKDKSRVGVCLDTCHAFAAGYDLRTPESFKGVLESFDDIVGRKNLSAMHINDSKAPFASHRDLHQNIGLGFLGLRAFHNVMNEPRFHDLPLVLETPISVKVVDDNGKEKESEDKSIWAQEIKMLESFIGMDAESEEFLKLEKELADKGADERKKYQDQYERKLEKDRLKAEKGKRKKGKHEDAVETDSNLSSDDGER